MITNSLKKFITSLILIMLFSSNLAWSEPDYENIDYKAIYDKLPTVTTNFDANEDPFDAMEYTTYYMSPYPLIRISTPLQIKRTILQTGYYILTPKNINDVDVVLFKQKSKILAVVPVFEKQKVDPDKIYPPIVQMTKPKKTTFQKVRHVIFLPLTLCGRAIKTTCRYFFEYEQPAPEKKIPRASVECFETDKGYYRINLYIEDDMYKMIFKAKEVQYPAPIPLHL